MADTRARRQIEAKEEAPKPAEDLASNENRFSQETDLLLLKWMVGSISRSTLLDVR